MMESEYFMYLNFIFLSLILFHVLFISVCLELYYSQNYDVYLKYTINFLYFACTVKVLYHKRSCRFHVICHTHVFTFKNVMYFV